MQLTPMEVCVGFQPQCKPLEENHTEAASILKHEKKGGAGKQMLYFRSIGIVPIHCTEVTLKCVSFTKGTYTDTF